MRRRQMNRDQSCLEGEMQLGGSEVGNGLRRHARDAQRMRRSRRQVSVAMTEIVRHEELHCERQRGYA